MSERPEEQQNWQLRQYDSFGPHFRKWDITGQ